MLQNRGEFVLILATLATSAGLDARLTPFAGLYVLSMGIIGPILAVNPERIGRALFPTRATPRPVERDRMRAEGIALLAEAATAEPDSREAAQLDDLVEHFPIDDEVDEAARQAAEQSDEVATRQRDPEY